jgi:tetratricopeptide (TPR) repeat protein
LVRVTNTAPSPLERDLPFPVEWHERVPPAEMGAIYRSLDVFLGTSSGAEEGFFLPAVEAMACGVPCVLTDIPCFRAHGDGQYALFVPARDPAAMAEAMVMAGRVPETAQSLRAAGIAAAARYTQDAHGGDLEQVLTALVASQRATVPQSAGDGQPGAPGDDVAALRTRLLRALLAAAAHCTEQQGNPRAAQHAADLLAAAHCLNRADGELAAAAAWWRHLAGDTNGALRMLDRCVDDGIDDRAVHERRAALLNLTGRPAAAAQALRAAIAAGGRTACAYNNLGVALYRTGDLAGARSSFERALTLDPGHADALANVAELPTA